MQPDAALNFYAENRYLIKAVFGLVTTILLAALFLPRLAHIASRIGLVDMPSKRKTHAGAKPLVGGLGMAMALAVTCLIFVPLTNLRGFYAGFVLLVIIGFLDDFRELKYGGKFIAQIFAILFMVFFSKISLDTFGNLLGMGAINFGIMAVPVTVFCAVGVIHAFNMADGLDGLAGGIALVAFLTFAVLAYLNAQPDLALLAIAFSGALIGFLWYNRPPSRLFMGDAGSMSIGFALVFFALAVTQKAGGSVSPVTPLLILAVPVCDTIRIIIARLLRGQSPFTADNKHLHHLLIRFGFNRKCTVLIIIGLSAAFALFAVIGTLLRMPDYLFFAAFLIYGGVYTAVSVSMRSILIAKLKLKKKQSEQYMEGSRYTRIMLVLAMVARIRRRERRIVVKMPVASTREGRTIAGELTDLSASGFSAIFGEKFTIGDMARYELRMPELPARLEASAEVIWTARTIAGYKYGFRFASIGRPEAEMLRIYLDNLQLRASWPGTRR
jgi:UDP-GlcNAc:undecaprenyl-phosphate GlcNAc-1-phosphate transferase